MVLDVIYEDNHLLIINKPAGMLIQGDSTGDKPLVEHAKDYLKQKYNKPGAVFLGVVHRLDRPVSGVVCFARTSKALERMNALFKDRKINKLYWAVTKKKPRKKENTLTHWLKKDGTKNITTSYDYAEKGALKATLHYEYLGTLNEHHLIEVRPVTGRPHQIRVQLATEGFPIKGDLRYGFHQPNSDKSINLHARRLDFIHPVKKEPVIAIAGLPRNDFWEQFLILDKTRISDKKLDYLQ